VLDEIFEKTLKGPKIFKNKSVLFHDYIPSRLLFREEHITRLGYSFAPLLRGQRSSNLFIYGKPGTGKTAVTKYVIARLKQKAREINTRIYVSYVNCRTAGTEYRVVSALARDVNLSVPFTGLSVEEILNRFKLRITSEKTPVLVVLDEVDFLVTKYSDDILYTLTRINSPDEGKANLMLVGISNDLRFKEYLDPRVLSSLSEEEVVFKPYTPEELEAILLDRVPEAFYEGSVSEEAIKLCAAISGAEHGDARKALDLLRIAGEIAEELGSPKLSPDHVKMACERIERDKTMEIIHTLPLHSRLVLTSIYLCIKSDADRVKSSIAYVKYCELAKALANRPLSNRRFISLVKELSVLGLLDRRIENYGRRGGRVTLISLAFPKREIEKALIKDPLISEILNKTQNS